MTTTKKTGATVRVYEYKASGLFSASVFTAGRGMSAAYVTKITTKEKALAEVKSFLGEAFESATIKTYKA